jgi:hypothetical protein
VAHAKKTTTAALAVAAPTASATRKTAHTTTVTMGAGQLARPICFAIHASLGFSSSRYSRACTVMTV